MAGLFGGRGEASGVGAERSRAGEAGGRMSGGGALDAELMARVRMLRLRARRAVDEVFAGDYASAFKGRGMEFSEVRAYEPGDDVRSIDWNVTARAGHPFVKRYVEERELTLMLVVDVSASGAFGTVAKEKRETAAELCAVLAAAAVRSNDKVGLVTFDDEVVSQAPAKKGQKHGMRVLRELLQPVGLESGEERRSRLARLFGSSEASAVGTDPMSAIEHLGRRLKKRAIVVFVSDFLFGEERMGEVEDGLRLLSRRNDLILARVSDPRESELPRVGLMELADLETGERRWVDTSSRRVRRRVRESAERHAARVETMAKRCRADLLEVSTDGDWVHGLLELFRRRERRMAR